MNGKSAGTSGILPEMVKAGFCGGVFSECLTDLVYTDWKEQNVPKDWPVAILIPIPKKGNLSYSDSWHGIVLLEVVGKLTVRIIQDRELRLHSIAKDKLPETINVAFERGMHAEAALICFSH